MGMHQGTLTAAEKPIWRRQQFWRVTLPILAALSVVVAGLLVYNAYYGSNGVTNATGWGVTYPAATNPKTVKLPAEVPPLVRRFVRTAVARTDLATAYALSGPEIRQGMTLKQFLTGNIAVVPYTIRPDTKITIKVDSSYASSAQLEVFLVTPHVNVHSPHTFFADLIKRDGRWYVNSWVPRWTPPIPTQPGR